MLYKSLVWSEARGSLAGLTFQGGRSTAVARARHRPLDRRSPRQLQSRHSLARLRALWRETYTEDVREGWRSYAERTTFRNEGGEVVHLTGEQAFCRGNVVRLVYGGVGGIRVGPPTVAGLPFADVTGVVASFVLQAIGLGWNPLEPWVFQNTASLYVWVSRMQNPSVNRLRRPYVFHRRVDGGTPTAFAGFFLGATSVPLVFGHAMFAKVAILDQDGRYGVVYRTRVLVNL